MERKDLRLLSSLRDLKLRSKCSMILTEERKRKQKRLCPIKVRLEDQEKCENFKILEKKKNVLDLSFISKSLANHFTFSSLITDKVLHDQLIEQFRMCQVEQGEYLMKQNDNATCFFILLEGDLQVEVNGEAQGKISNGDGFGELALLYSTPRSASILAKKKSLLWFIDRSTFRNVVSSIIEKTMVENKKFINENKFFAYLTQKQKAKIASIAISQKYEAGAKVCREGTLASAMYIIKSGKLTRSIDGVVIGSYQSGDSLEQYVTLSKGSLRKETVTAEESTDVIALGADDIEKALGKSLPIIILRNTAISAMNQDKNLKVLSKQFAEKFIDSFKIQKVAAGETVFKEGDPCKNKIFFVIQGQYQLTKGNSKKAIYGTQALSSKNREQGFSYQLTMISEGKIAITSLEDVEKALGFTIQQAIQKSISIRKIFEGRHSVLQDLKNKCQTYKLEDFLIVKKLGQGQFGQVFLVAHHQTKKLYALKCISKADTLKYKLEKHLINQKTVLESHNSPFTVDFIRSFKDNHYVYFLTQFIDGLELFDALRVIGLVPIDLAQFYTATMILALESLHAKGIIYRDLKPENAMVQADGYLKIIDMGTCKNLKNSVIQKTFTIIGTPNYMAPEILSGKGYGYSVDLWSLGIVLFQFLSGYLPFGENCDDPYEIYEEVLKVQLKFPKYMKDSSANNLISRLLNRNAEARLGGSYSSLKDHQFFKKIEWHQIIEKSIKPSFQPSKDSLFKMGSMPKNPKSVSHYLKSIEHQQIKRPDLNPNWDSCF